MFENYYPLMKDLFVVIVTLGVFALFVYLYLVLRPTVVIPPNTKHSGCPDRWLEKNGECVPMYETHCQPYIPSLYVGNECDIAKACGTTFKGICN